MLDFQESLKQTQVRVSKIFNDKLGLKSGLMAILASSGDGGHQYWARSTSKW